MYDDEDDSPTEEFPALPRPSRRASPLAGAVGVAAAQSRAAREVGGMGGGRHQGIQLQRKGTMTGTEWQVDRIDKVTDGDTVRLIRSRIEHMGDHDFRITDVTSMPIRLVWVDTPEKGDHPGWETARADLTTWIAARGRIRGPKDSASSPTNPRAGIGCSAT
jgi:endonuclease YncB( thermonuclease family)